MAPPPGGRGQCQAPPPGRGHLQGWGPEDRSLHQEESSGISAQPEGNTLVNNMEGRVTMVMVSVVMVTVVMVTWAMAWSCPRETSGPGHTDRLEGSSLTSDAKPSDMLK